MTEWKANYTAYADAQEKSLQTTKVFHPGVFCILQGSELSGVGCELVMLVHCPFRMGNADASRPYDLTSIMHYGFFAAAGLGQEVCFCTVWGVLEAIPIRLEAIALWLEAVASSLEAIDKALSQARTTMHQRSQLLEDSQGM